MPPHLKGKIKREIRDSIDNGITVIPNSDAAVWDTILNLDGDPHFGCKEVEREL
jgi:hypothetical protein